MPRTVQNNLLVSESLPAASFRVDPRFTYVGSTSFILYDIAQAEQHHFVVADAGKRVERLLWSNSRDIWRTTSAGIATPSWKR